MGRSALLVAVAALLPACDVAFGLERDDEPVTVELTHRYVFNDHEHSSTTRETPFTIEDLPSVEVFTREGERLEADVTYPLSSFTFRRPPGAGYRLVLHLADVDQPVEVQSTVTRVKLRFDAFHRPDAVKTPPSTSLSGVFTPAGAATMFFTGYTGQVDLGVGPGYAIRPEYMLDSGQFDRAYVVQYGTIGTVSSIARVGMIDVQMRQGMNDASVEVLPIPAAYCAHVMLDQATELARLSAGYPDYVDGGGAAWALYATPTLEALPSQLYAIAVPAIQQLPTDAQFAVPFIGWLPLLDQGTQVQRKVSSLVTLYAGMTALAALPASTNCEPATIEPAPVAIPTHPVLDGIALDRDDLVIPRRAIHELVFEADGRGELFDTAIYDVTTTQRLLRSIGGAEPRFAIDDALFEPGHTYVVRIGARHGVPNTATGDFATITFPHASASGYSSLFTIAAD